MSKKELFIYGAGGLGREILSLINATADWMAAGFIDDNVPRGSEVNGLRVFGGSDFLLTLKVPTYLVLAIGDPQLKCEILKKIKNPVIRYATIVHPAAILQDKNSIELGEGTIVTAGCTLTTGIRVGKHVLINLNTTIGHDVHIGNFSSIMPGVNIAGEVIIGEAVLIGSGANILNRMVVSDRAKVGMGAVVIHPVQPGTTVVGVPAKRVRS
jgi:sugar O-acyltransferase (sialic acid O-acetyltransferase NeuD family)